MISEKNEEIDIMKFLGTIFVVLGHVAMLYTAQSLFSPAESSLLMVALKDFILRLLE